MLLGLPRRHVQPLTFDLRDKVALTLDRGAVDAVTVEATGQPTTILVAPDRISGRSQSPINARADFAAVDAIVGKFQQAQMKTIVAADGTKDLKTYGLDTAAGGGHARRRFDARRHRDSGAKKDDTARLRRDPVAAVGLHRRDRSDRHHQEAG